MRLRRADFPHWTQATEMRGPRSLGDRAMRRSCCTKIELRDRMWLCCVQHPSLVNAHETFRASGRAEGSRAFANSPADLPEISVANEVCHHTYHSAFSCRSPGTRYAALAWVSLQ